MTTRQKSILQQILPHAGLILVAGSWIWFLATKNSDIELLKSSQAAQIVKEEKDIKDVRIEFEGIIKDIRADLKANQQDHSEMKSRLSAIESKIDMLLQAPNRAPQQRQE